MKNYLYGRGLTSYIYMNKFPYFNFETFYDCINALKENDLEQFIKEIKKFSQAVYEITVYNYENINQLIK